MIFLFVSNVIHVFNITSNVRYAVDREFVDIEAGGRSGRAEGWADVPNGAPRDPLGPPLWRHMGFPWIPIGHHGRPLAPHGSPRAPMGPNGSPFGPPCAPHGHPMAFHWPPMGPHERPMGTPWATMVLQWVPYGPPWAPMGPNALETILKKPRCSLYAFLQQDLCFFVNERFVWARSEFSMKSVVSRRRNP